MSYEKRVRQHRQVLKKLLSSLNSTLESPPNVIANNKLIVISAIIEKVLMLVDEAIRAGSLQPQEVEEILDHYAIDSANYGNNPAIDEINSLKHEIQYMSKASEILSAIRRRREIGHRLVGFHPRILGPWNKWIRTLEQYKINDQISEKHRTSLLADLDEWVATLEEHSE